MSDVNFDQRAERLQQRIYATPKGRLRLELVWADLCDLLGVEQSALRVWDAGGGMGQMSTRLAEAGHSVLLSDLSANMLEQAAALLAASPGGDRVELRQGALQDMAQHSEAAFDLVLCHAVLEWLADPLAALPRLLSSVRPGGAVSLLVYNEAALILKRLRRGQWQRVLQGDVGGMSDGRGLTPPSPLRAAAVIGQLRQHGFELLGCTGVRCAYDWLPPDERDRMPWPDLLALERRLAKDADFIGTARYLHLCARRG